VKYRGDSGGGTTLRSIARCKLTFWFLDGIRLFAALRAKTFLPWGEFIPCSIRRSARSTFCGVPELVGFRGVNRGR